jgi:hypothetical protein
MLPVAYSPAIASAARVASPSWPIMNTPPAATSMGVMGGTSIPFALDADADTLTIST